jgi:Domain of unknown function (DUF4384)
MTMSPKGPIARTPWPLAFAAIAALAGCASLDPAPAVTAQVLPVAAASRPLGDFSAGLRCMDNLLLDYGTRDLSVIVEDLADPTKRVSSGTKDMLVSAVSDMTQRSRAIRLVASGKDWGQTLSHMTQALQREPFAVVPQYALRGSISLLDNAGTQPKSGDGATPAGSVLGLDLTLLTTQDMSVVPGTSSRNAAALSARGTGLESRAEIRKFGLQFSVANGANEGQPQALRALVDLAAIELFGRLTKVPYWTCVGATAADETVAAEVQDWYDAMATRPAEIITYFQLQLRQRRVYDGPIDGVVNPQFKEAVARYRAALGLSREPKLSLDFFKAYLSADHRQLEARVPPEAAPATPPAPTDTPALALRIAAGNDGRRFARGEAVQLMIRPNRDAHVYCYLQDETRKITRFFPNRFQRDSRVQPAAGLQLPGAMRFEIVMNPRGVQETVACFATERDVLAQLPAGVNAGDFDPLPVTTFEQVRSAFVKVSGGTLAQESLQLRAK